MAEMLFEFESGFECISSTFNYFAGQNVL